MKTHITLTKEEAERDLAIVYKNKFEDNMGLYVEPTVTIDTGKPITIPFKDLANSTVAYKIPLIKMIKELVQDIGTGKVKLSEPTVSDYMANIVPHLPLVTAKNWIENYFSKLP